MLVFYIQGTEQKSRNINAKSHENSQQSSTEAIIQETLPNNMDGGRCMYIPVLFSELTANNNAGDALKLYYIPT